jgi:hypothetical protein
LLWVTYFASRKTSLIETKKKIPNANKQGWPATCSFAKDKNKEGGCKRKCKMVMDSAGGNTVGFGLACIVR